MGNESEKLLDNIVEAVCQHRGQNFSSAKESQRCFDQTKNEVAALIQQGDTLLIEGLHILQECRGGHVRDYVSDIAARLLNNLDSPKKLASAVEKIWQNENSLIFVHDVIESFYDCGDLDKEHRLIMVYLALFPFNPQPYICLGAFIWRRDGFAEAERYYGTVAPAFNDPVVDYYAAECFCTTGDKVRARETLQRALANAEKSLSVHSDTKHRLRELLEQCQ